MPRLLIRLLGAAALATVLAVWSGCALPVAADGGASGIIVTPPIVSPGDEISIQGSALWTELPVTIRLVGRTGASRQIGSGLTSPDGSLSTSVTVPDDVPVGQYTVLVLNAYGEEAGAPVVVEPEFPILPLLVLGGATLVVGLVALAAWRRRTPDDRGADSAS